MTANFLLREASPPRYLAVAEALRRRIDEGVYPAGGKLPNEKELAREFDVSVMTVRQGVGLLVKKGMVERKQGCGTFVTSVSRAVANIALLVGDSISVESAHYYRAVLRRLQAGALDRKWELRHYDRLNRSMFPDKVVSKNEQLFLKDHRNDPFHGVIEFVPGDASLVPKDLADHMPTAVMEPGLPFTDVIGDDYHFGEQAVRHLVKSGCRNLLFFCTHWHTHRMPDSVDAVLDETRKMKCPVPFVECQPVDGQGYEMESALYRKFRQMIASWGKNNRPVPDGLIFNDDIALRSVMPALLQAGISIPKDMKIFCLGNEDRRIHYGVPVCRYEISPGAIAGHLLKAMDCRIRGVKAPAPHPSKGKIFVDKP